MPNILLDAACTIDGFWADVDGKSIYPIDEMHRSGLVEAVAERAGAVVMSEASFRMVDDPDWYADNYELQRPIFVVSADTPANAPSENDKLSFHFVPTYEAAIDGALAVCGPGDVVIIGEASAVQAVLDLGRVDEIYLRIIPRILGEGISLFGRGSSSRRFRRIAVNCSDETTHIHFALAD